MGCSSHITLENNKYKSAYECLKSLLNYIKKNNILEIEVFLVSAKSIPNFIKIIEDFEGFENLSGFQNKDNNRENNENIKNSEMALKRKLLCYNSENISIYYDYNSCIKLMELNHDKKNEFIIADNKFMDYMNVNTEINQYKKVKISTNVNKSKMFVKFQDQNILFREKKFCIFEFYENNDYKNLINKENVENNIKYAVEKAEKKNYLNIKNNSISEDNNLKLNNNIINNNINKQNNHKSNNINDNIKNMIMDNNINNNGINNINNINNNINSNNIKNYNISNKINNYINNNVNNNIINDKNNNINKNINFNINNINNNINDKINNNLNNNKNKNVSIDKINNNLNYNNNINEIIFKDKFMNIKNNLIDNNMNNNKTTILINNKSNINDNENNNNKNEIKKNIIKLYKFPTLIGLNNSGSMCYMNAPLQCLSNISALTNYFLVNKEEFLLIPKYSNKKKICKAYSDVIYNLWDESNSKSSFDPHYFKEIVGQENKNFEGNSAGDSKDLILFLYGIMHLELNEKNHNDIQEEDIISDGTIPSIELYKCRNHFYSQNKSIITDLFYFDKAQIQKCINCGELYYNFSIYNILIFPLEKVRLFKLQKERGFENVNIIDCFDCYTSEDKNNNPEKKLHCTKCNKDTDYTLYNIISSFPEILTIILNRGHHLKFDVEFQISYTLENLERYMIKLEDDNDKKIINIRYRLIGIIIHIGKSGDEGHFYTYCRSPVDKKWYSYNDEKVKYISDPLGEIKGIPYLLFYEKIKN